MPTMEIIPQFGLSTTISSDNGPHLRANINEEVCQYFRIKQQFHCVHHPQAAGIVEMASGTLKTTLAIQFSPEDWT